LNLLTDFRETWYKRYACEGYSEYSTVVNFIFLVSMYQHGGHANLEIGRDISALHKGFEFLCSEKSPNVSKLY
jgi:hypothetical protein